MAAGDFKKLLVDAGLSAEEIAETEKAFNPKAIEAVEKGVMRQADYSRKQDELAAERRELEAKWERANAEYQRMFTESESTQAERDEAKAKLQEAERKLSSQPQIDPSKFMTPEQYLEKQREYAQGQTAYFGDILEIADEHRELFGKRISPMELIQKAQEAKKVPRQFWEETYQVTAKRDELAKSREEEKANAIRKEEREKVIAEFSRNPESRPLSSSKSPFYTPEGEGKSPWDDQGPSEAEQKFLGELLQSRG
jgi:hypothetical protein